MPHKSLMLKFVLLSLILKILIILLGLYFAVIVSLPCQDNTGLENQCQSDNKCGDEHEENNGCQPFCNCACCSSAINNHLITLEFSLSFYRKTSPFFYLIEFSYQFLPSIWQPPKIS